MNVSDNDYKQWITEVKQKIRSAQIKAAIAVNSALIEFYWELGKMLAEQEKVWGSKLIEQVSKDLKAEFPEMTGISERNLKYCRFFYQFYNSKISQQPVGLIGQQAVAQLPTTENQIDQQVVGLNLPDSLQSANKEQASAIDSDRTIQQLVLQIPWGHNILIFTKSKSTQEAFFYIQKTIENNWSRDVLALQIKSDLFARQGKAITNFTHTLPEPNSDLAKQSLKDPYIFDFLQLTEDYKERDIENQLTQHITKFLLELGKGFAFIGRQYYLQLGEKEYFIDLLFYHIPMQCYVVVELKNKEFEPEFAGKLNFYLTLIDKTMKREQENPSIGILLCRGKNNLEVEYALQDIHKPIGVSEFNLEKNLPENLKSSLPTIEEIENELSNYDKTN